MGTSKSSSGSPSGIPLVPPWVPQNPQKPNGAEPNPITPVLEQPFTIPNTSPLMNPKINTSSPKSQEGRFRAARSQLGQFAKNGDQDYLKRGVGNYAKIGLGGKKQAARRFAGTANLAGILYGALEILSNTSTNSQGLILDRNVLSGKSAEDVISAVINVIRPLDGTQDAESNRASLNDALVELLETNPNIDLLNLNSEEKEFVIERFIACDIYRRFILDVGNAIRNKAPNATTASSRLKTAKDYIRETVSASFRRLKAAQTTLGQANVTIIIKKLLEDAFSVFEEYIK